MDGVDGNKQLVFGVLDTDLAERTTLSVGGIWQKLKATHFPGLPAYMDGRLLDVARSAAYVADWSNIDSETKTAFVELEHRLAGGGSIKASARWMERFNPFSWIWVGTGPYGVGDDGSAPITGVRNGAEAPNEDFTYDVYLSKPFELGGQTHNLLVGADYRTAESSVSVRQNFSSVVQNVFSYDPGLVPLPPATPYYWGSTDIESYGAYGQLRYKLLDALTFIAGARISWWKSDRTDRLTNLPMSSYDAKSEFTPYGALVLDVTQALSLYGSYSEIFVPQNATTFEGSQLDPRVGGQYEFGVKGEFRDGMLNMHAAVFRIQDKNRATADLAHPGFSLPVGEVRSEGFETEISGRLTERLSLTAGYAFNETKYIDGQLAVANGQWNTFTPKHNFNLWAHYRLPERLIGGMEVGGGVRAVSEFFALSGPIRYVGDAYTVASLMAGYRINGRYKVDLNVENLFDKKYWSTVSGPYFSNFYGAPRSVTLTLRAKW